MTVIEKRKKMTFFSHSCQVIKGCNLYSVENVKGELYSSLHFCSYCKEKEAEAGCLSTDPACIDPFLVTFVYLSDSEIRAKAPQCPTVLFLTAVTPKQ